MSIRVDTSSLIAGAVVVGHSGLGIPAQAIPAVGEHGPGYAYSSIDLILDHGREIRGVINSWPKSGVLRVFEDTSFTFQGHKGEYDFTWQLYLDGQATGSPQTVRIVLE